MTQNLERVAVPAGDGEPDRRGTSVDKTKGKRARRWFERPWVIPLAVIVVAFLLYIWPPYFGLDPNQSLIPIRSDSPQHYPLLVLHIAFGSVALLTVCLQLWPWLRRHHPAVHRWSGRTYVFAGAIPAGLTAMLITPLSPAPTLGTTLGGVLWLITTTVGFVRARQRRYRAHRRWMLYSFAFAINIVWGRVFGVVFTELGVTDPALWAQIGLTAPWLGWVINLFLVQWWLNRTATRPVGQLA
jgi:hypothetical protein